MYAFAEKSFGSGRGFRRPFPCAAFPPCGKEMWTASAVYKTRPETFQNAVWKGLVPPYFAKFP